MSNIFEHLHIDSGWLLKIFLVIIFFSVAHIIIKVLFNKLKARHKKPIRSLFFATFELPAVLILWSFAITLTLTISMSYVEVKPTSLPSIEQLRTLFIVIVLTWFAFTFKRRLQKAATKKESGLDRAKVDVLGKFATLVIVVFAIIFAMDALGFNMQTLSIIGGISGFSLGFAGKDVISNFFGGLMLYITRPFVVGDTIKSKEKGFEGVVEEISWYYTIVMGSDKQPIYIPNSLFANILVTNLTRMSHWNIEERIGVRYKDMRVIDEIVNGIKQILQKDPNIDQNQPIRVHFDKFAPSSLEIALWACAIPTKKDDVIGIKQEIFLKIARHLTTLDADFAYQTTTIEIPEGLKIVS